MIMAPTKAGALCIRHANYRLAQKPKRMIRAPDRTVVWTNWTSAKPQLARAHNRHISGSAGRENETGA